MRLKLIFVILLTGLLICVSGCGVSKETHAALEEDLATAKEKLAKTQIDHDSLKEKYDSLKKEHDQYVIDSASFMQLNQAEQEAQIQVAKRENDIKGLEKQKTDLETKVSQLEEKIKELKADAIKIIGQEKKYPAGYLFVGKDFAPGRYKVFGGSSNFFVYDASGRLRVNIILGTSYGVNEYIYTFADGDEVEANSSFKLVPIE